jgi:hypothetical protein
LNAGLGAQPITDEGAGSLHDKKPARRNFASRRDQPRLTSEQAARQGLAVTSALRSFASPGAAIAFLNGDHPRLGRPLDRAVLSAAGLAEVETALALYAPTAG